MPAQETIPSVAKSIRLMRAAGQGLLRGTVHQIGRSLGIAPTTCFRILKTLTEADWLRPTGAGWELSAGMLPVIRPLLEWGHVAEAVGDELQRLVARTRLSAKLSIRRGGDQVTIARREAPTPMSVVGRVGSRFPVVEGASGAALLCEVDEPELGGIIDAAPDGSWAWQSPDDLRRRVAACRTQGLCENIGAHPRGIDTLAAAVRADGHEPLALTLIGLRGDFDAEALATCREALKDAAGACCRRLAALPRDAAAGGEAGQ